MRDMRFTISPVRLGRLPSVVRRGFTFTEVLFAVMLLGIGFIMVAAIFPVAIQQSQANRDDTSGVIVAKAGAKIMESVQFAQTDLIPNIETYLYYSNWKIVRPFADYPPISPGNYTLFSKIKGSLINKSDPRYAWVPLGYKLSQPMLYPSSTAPQCTSLTVYIVAVACRNKSTYDERDIIIPGSNKAAFTFQPKEIHFRLKDGGLDPDTIEFSNPKTFSFSAYDEPAAAEGAFVLVANDQYNSGHARYRDANGRIYRIGVKRADRGTGVWELMPGYDLTNDLENIPSVDNPKSNKPAVGYMVGRGYSDPSNRNSPPEGPAQDLFAMPVIVDLPLKN